MATYRISTMVAITTEREAASVADAINDVQIDIRDMLDTCEMDDYAIHSEIVGEYGT